MLVQFTLCEMRRRGIAESLLQQPAAQAELGTRLLIGVGREVLIRAHRFTLGRRRLAPHPRPQQRVMIGRVDTGELLVHVRAEGGLARSHELTGFIDPEDGRDVHDVVEIGHRPRRVDEARVRRAGGLDPLTRIVEVALEADGDDLESVGRELFV